jgi:type II secretory pathway component PulM
MPVPQPPVAAPKGNALQRMVRASTHAMGLLSLSLLGTPANTQ